MMLPPRSSTSPACPGCDVAATLADDAHLEARAGPAHGGGDRFGVVLGRRGAGGAALRQPVPGDDLREGELVVDPADQLHGDVGRAGHRHAQGGEIVPRPCRGGRGSTGTASAARGGR